jgi:hypothetical protein
MTPLQESVDRRIREPRMEPRRPRMRGVRAPYRRTAHTAHTAIRGCVVGRHVGACGLRAERIPVRSRASALPPGVIDAYLG